MAKAPGTAPRSYLITGASSGLGAELARQLAARGDRLALLARREDRLAEVRDASVAAARTSGVAEPFVPLLYKADVADTAALAAAIASADQALPGGIDVAVLNAGIGGEQRVDRFDAAEAARTIDVDLTANVHAVGALLRPMIERRRGHIVGVSSLAAYRSLPGSAAYCAAKAGLTMFLESIRIDLRPFGIGVTVVSPGFVRSELTAKNRFPMPFILETDDACRRIIRGVDRRAREVRFPLPLVFGLGLARALPTALWEWMASRTNPRRVAAGAPKP